MQGIQISLGKDMPMIYVDKYDKKTLQVTKPFNHNYNHIIIFEDYITKVLQHKGNVVYVYLENKRRYNCTVDTNGSQTTCELA